MAQNVSLTPEQLQSLDLLIEQLKADPDILAEIAHAVVEYVVHKVFGPPPPPSDDPMLTRINAGELSVDDLIELRKQFVG